MYLQLNRAPEPEPSLTGAPCDLLGPWCGDAGASCEPVMAFPALRVAEDHAYIHVCTELPGMEPDELEISVDGATLTLRGYPRGEDRRRCREPHGLRRPHGFRVERGFESFLCRVQLPGVVDSAHSEAHLDGGVLFLTLPRLTPEPACAVTMPARAPGPP